MPVSDERLHQLAYDPMMFNITPEVLECLRELDGLRWKKITAEDLPTIGDEMVGVDRDGIIWLRNFQSFMADDDPAEMLGYMHQEGWTHFRPINPPAPRPA